MKKFSEFKMELGENALYRFVPFNLNSLRSLINSTLYFGDPHFQNDPVDSNYILDVRSFPHEFFGSDLIIYPDLETRTKLYLKTAIDGELKEDYGICCFSKIYNMILLWSHYSQGATGISFVFDRTKLLDNLKESNDTMEIIEVCYDNIPIIKPKVKGDDIVIDYRKILSNKIKQWKYESEIRILCVFKKGIMERKNRIFNYNPESLRGILIGERIRHEDFITLKNIMKLPKFEHISLFKKHRNEYNPRSYQYSTVSLLEK